MSDSDLIDAVASKTGEDSQEIARPLHRVVGRAFAVRGGTRSEVPGIVILGGLLPVK